MPSLLCLEKDITISNNNKNCNVDVKDARRRHGMKKKTAVKAGSGLICRTLEIDEDGFMEEPEKYIGG